MLTLSLLFHQQKPKKDNKEQVILDIPRDDDGNNNDSDIPQLIPKDEESNNNNNNGGGKVKKQLRKIVPKAIAAKIPALANGNNGPPQSKDSKDRANLSDAVFSILLYTH